MSSEEDVRPADASFSDQLIGNFEQELIFDDEINQAIQASIKTAQDEFSRINKQEKYKNQIEFLTKIDEERIILENYRIQNLKEKKIEERELEMRNTIAFLSRFRLKDLLLVLNVFIQDGKKIDFKYYNEFKKELKPSEFKKIEYIFNDSPCEEEEEEDYDSEYTYDSDYKKK